VAGSKSSGKSSLLALATQMVAQELSSRGELQGTLLLPLSFTTLFDGAPPPPLSLHAVHETFVSVFFHSFCTSRPLLKEWRKGLKQWWLGDADFPAGLAERQPTVSGLLRRHLQRHVGVDANVAESLQALFALPSVLMECGGFERILWIVDDLDCADILVAADDGSRRHAAMLPTLSGALCGVGSHVIASCSADSVPRVSDLLHCPPTLSTRGMISTTSMKAKFPQLPSSIRCAGQEYDMDVFGGCPGFIAPFIALVAASPSGEGTCLEFHASESSELAELFKWLSLQHTS